MAYIIEVDARGEICPVPMMWAVKAMKQAQPGESIRLLFDHAPALDTIPSQVKRLGWEYQVEGSGEPDWCFVLTPKS